HVLPLARPGILTGTILSLSRAVGEAAPLVLFGALLFVNENPSLFSRFTILPMQIFGWADLPAEVVGGERVEIWRYNAAMASLLLLAVLLALNAGAVGVRSRAQLEAEGERVFAPLPPGRGEESKANGTPPPCGRRAFSGNCCSWAPASCWACCWRWA